MALLAAILPGGGLVATGSASERGNPFVRARLYVLRPGDVGADAADQAQAWSASAPRAAAELRQVARDPWAEWYGDWLADPGALFAERLRSWYAPNHATAFIALYNLPHRDCSGTFSVGGANSPGAYRAWIQDMARAIGSYPTIVVLEPDGLPDAGCLGPLEQQRLGLIRYATQTLASLPHTSVYIDAGRSDWLPAADTVWLLRQAGVRYARGFALDVTGYATTGDELSYGDRTGKSLGGKHFIINTSRNGNGTLPPRLDTGGQQELWCNTPGRALGRRPTTRTGDPLADAFEWGAASGLLRWTLPRRAGRGNLVAAVRDRARPTRLSLLSSITQPTILDPMEHKSFSDMHRSEQESCGR